MLQSACPLESSESEDVVSTFTSFASLAMSITTQYVVLAARVMPGDAVNCTRLAVLGRGSVGFVSVPRLSPGAPDESP